MSTAVICAHNPGRRNLGMYSVDLAAKDFFSSLGTKFELVKYAGHERIGEMRYRKIVDPQDLQFFDRIVFWGDFQQNPIWGRADFANRMVRERGVSDAGGTTCGKSCVCSRTSTTNSPRGRSRLEPASLALEKR